MAKILIVEDHAVIREPIEVALDSAGFETVAVSNGAKGLTAFAEHRPDMVLLDLAMPEMDGLTMLRALRAMPGGRDVPVIILSAISDKNKIVQAAALGIAGYVLKSRFSLRELLTLIRDNLPDAGKVESNVPQRAAANADVANAAASPVQVSEPRQDSEPASQDDSLDERSALVTPAEGSTEAEGALGASGREQLRAVSPVSTRNEIMKQLGVVTELKGFSPAVSEVLRLTSSPRCSMESVSRAISRDHGLALKILKLANSAVYTRGEPVDAVAKAVLRIGLGQIREVVLNLAVIDKFADAAAGEYIDVGQFWEHAIATGIIAAELARVRNEKEVDAAFTAGLLHDVGRLLMLEALQEKYTAVLECADRLRLPTEQVEQHMLGLQHAEVMEYTLKSWKFSKQLVTPVVLHHLSAGNIRTTAPQQVHEVATIALANRLAHALLLGHAGNQQIYPTEDLCELLRLESSVIEHIESLAPDETVKMKFALLAVSAQPNWAQLSVIHRDAIGTDFVPLYVSEAPALDAHRIFCDVLSMQSNDDTVLQANVGVISIRNGRDVDALWTRFQNAEKKAGAEKLPVIFISPTGKIAPPAPMTAGRRVVQLATPFAVKRFVEIVKSLLAPSEAVREAA